MEGHSVVAEAYVERSRVTHGRAQPCRWDVEALRGLLRLPKMQIHGILMKVSLTLLRFIELEFYLFIYFITTTTTKQPQDTHVF